MNFVRLIFIFSFLLINNSFAYNYSQPANYKNCSQGPIHVHAGNFNAIIPAIPSSSQKRFKSRRYTARQIMDRRYALVKSNLIRNGYIPLIKQAAKAFHLNPVHVLGSVIGEHVFNLDIKDSAQDYLLRLPRWMQKWVSSNNFEIPLEDVLDHPKFNICRTKASEYLKWHCYQDVWNNKFRGKYCSECQDTQYYPNKGLKFTFFSPFGSTYGPGQLGPMKALMVTDLVSSTLGHMPYLAINDIEEVYKSILEPDSAFIYIAATIVKIIETYQNTACFDISSNPGVVATLYNLGNEIRRAKEKRRLNLKALSKGAGIVYPTENYYGWYINEQAGDLENVLKNY